MHPSIQAEIAAQIHELEKSKRALLESIRELKQTMDAASEVVAEVDDLIFQHQQMLGSIDGHDAR